MDSDSNKGLLSSHATLKGSKCSISAGDFFFQVSFVVFVYFYTK